MHSVSKMLSYAMLKHAVYSYHWPLKTAWTIMASQGRHREAGPNRVSPDRLELAICNAVVSCLKPQAPEKARLSGPGTLR